MQQKNTLQEITFEQLKDVVGGSTSTSTCTKTETTKCNKRGTRCTTTTVEVCVKKP